MINKTYVSGKNLEELSTREILHLRQEVLKEGNIFSLLKIAAYRLESGSVGTSIDAYFEICYYLGRLNQPDAFEKFLENNPITQFLPSSNNMLGINLFFIGLKFPNLDESEISYLEKNYCDSKLFELFDVIMFDSFRLPRKIKKFDKEKLNIKHTEFSKDFLLKIYDCFSEYEYIGRSEDERPTYSRIENTVIKKDYESLDLGEYHITFHFTSNEIWNIINDNFDENCANWFAKTFSPYPEWEDFKEAEHYGFSPQSMESAAKHHFSDIKDVEKLKCAFAEDWLKTVNSKKLR